MTTLLLCDRFGAERNQMSQDIGTTLPAVHRDCSIDGSGQIVSLGQEMTLTSGRHTDEGITNLQGETPSEGVPTQTLHSDVRPDAVRTQDSPRAPLARGPTTTFPHGRLAQRRGHVVLVRVGTTPAATGSRGRSTTDGRDRESATPHAGAPRPNRDAARRYGGHRGFCASYRADAGSTARDFQFPRCESRERIVEYTADRDVRLAPTPGRPRRSD